MQFDEYEQELLELVENTDNFKQVNDLEQELADATLATTNYLNKTKNINIRITEKDLFALKRKSAKSNIPYQTILSSLIHKFAEGKIKLSI